MKAILVRKHGGEGVLEVSQVRDPQPGPGEVLVAVRAAGVNFADVLSRLGLYKAAPKPPFVPGIEIAGTVEGIGDGVQRFKLGDRVMGFCRFGGYAEKVAVPAAHVMRVPPDATFSEAAAFPVQYLTAYHGLFQLAHVRRTDAVLVHAAAGGVGLACLQLLKITGSRVFATVGNDAKAAVVKEEHPGASPIVYTRDDFARAVLGETGGQGVDVVMDSIGGATFRKSWALLRPYGRHVLFGAASAVRPGAVAKLGAAWRLRSMLAVSPLGMIDKNRTLAAFNLIHLADRADLLGEAAEELLSLWDAGSIKPRVGLSLPLDKAAEAHRRLQDRSTVGKVVLTVP